MFGLTSQLHKAIKFFFANISEGFNKNGKNDKL
ncbi:MAG: hypothetical protein IPH84_12080 [Bacteroidales bacterium]|nr:hypothetical protein [Bacteroidales bacterium]